MNDKPESPPPSSATANLKAALARKAAAGPAHASIDGGREGERQAAAASAARSNPAARRLSKRG